MFENYKQSNHLIKVFFVVFIFWLILSGIPTIGMIALGVLSSLLIIFLINKMDIIDHETSLLNFKPIRLLIYFFWLIKEMVLSNILVCYYIISPKAKINPSVIKVKASQKSAVGKVLYANSITFTPGTVTIDINGDNLIIHVLAEPFKNSMLKNTMDSMVKSTESEIHD
ncbi:MAG: Na+/H+ antiporter subunit E [Pseudomonadota bacterium]|nr:Na+/H+ antiporter subunit E [Pseudomonadota bacterium]|tara:strand:- start:286 stop:792 length:507 start_codon:yes stop_codon:yes gene_type:complete